MGKKEQEQKREARRNKRDAILKKAWNEADAITDPVTMKSLRVMSSSADAYQRLLALMIVRRKIREDADPRDYFAFAYKMITDSDNNCRWQAVIVIGESIKTDPDAVWKVVSEFGDSEDEDMRNAIACVLLEELLDNDFARYFPRVRSEVSKGRTRFLKTLNMCWFDDCKGPNYERAQRYLEKGPRGVTAPRRKRKS